MLETAVCRSAASAPAWHSENEVMRPVTAAARTCSLTLALMGAAGPALCSDASSDDEFRRNGVVSRHLWAPQAARTEVAGVPVSLGVALGLRGHLRTQLGTRIAPAVHFELDRRSSMALLASGKGGAMLVWQRSN
jgi:hypothetical protein